MLKKYKLLFIILIIINSNNTEANQNEKPDNNIIDYSDKLIIRPFISIPSVKINISHYDDNDLYKLGGITYKPNNYFDNGISIFYKIFGLSISSTYFSETYNTRDKNKYGESENTNIQFSYYANKFGLEIYYQNYKGFYLSDSSKYGYNNQDPETIRPDLKMSNYDLNFHYIFSDDFAFSASMQQVTKQKKSAGSFLLMVSVGKFKITSDYSLIPAEKQDSYEDYADYTGGIYYSVAFLPGYAYSFIYNNFYITPALFIGFGALARDETFEFKDNEQNSKYFNKLNARISAGYNGDKYFYGILGVNDTTSTRSWLLGSGTKISFQVIKVEFFVGMRI